MWWGPPTHELFPAAARERAVQLLLLGHRLSREERFFMQEAALFDVWLEHVMPRAMGGRAGDP